MKFEQYLDKKDIVNLAQASRTIHRDFEVLASQFVLVLLKNMNAILNQKFIAMKKQRDMMKKQRDMCLGPLARYFRDVQYFEQGDDYAIFNSLKWDSHQVHRIADDSSGYVRLGLDMDQPEIESESEDE